MLNTTTFKQGDIFSESSHYILMERVGPDKYKLHHEETGTDVTIGESYMANIFKSADQFTQTVKVGKEDKFWTQKQIDEFLKTNPGFHPQIPQVGDLKLRGIRTIWEDIHSQHVFTVCFKKADKPLSAKRLKEVQDAQIELAVNAILKAQTSKKGVAKAAQEELARLQQHPILPYEVGEERVLRGFKVQFTSRDGRYDCIDMDIDTEGGKVSALRPVNINTLLYLIFDGVKYEVE